MPDTLTLARAESRYNKRPASVSAPTGRRPQMNPATKDQFNINWRSFHERYSITDGCWEWVGSLNQHGYGYVFVQRQKCRKKFWAHRLSFEFFNGPIPENHCVCHRCDNRKCVNPAHLFAGSIAENNQDMHAKGRWLAPSRPGELCVRAKLKQPQVIEILHLVEAGFTHREIAAKFGVARSTVSLILCGATWRNIPRGVNNERK